MKKLWFTKAISLLAAGVLLSGAFAGCGGGGGDGESTQQPTPPAAEEVGFDYETEMLSRIGKDNYNSELFYVNNLEFKIADPTVIQITEGPEAGYFYVYGTSDDIIGNGFQCWRSKDLAHWESRGIAYQPDHGNTWASYNHWAPEIIYDETDKLYYLFYNADNFNVRGTNEIARMYLSVACSESPAGPFVSPSIRNQDGVQLSPDKPVFDFTENNPKVKQRAEDTGMTVRTNTLDASPFVDSNGDKYLYFGARNDSEASDYDGTHLYGVKMKDWFTPDYSTMTQLTYQGYKTVQAGINGDTSKKIAEGNINEGPFMMKHGNNYYLTYSIFGMHQPTYRVMQAIGDSPLGNFTKLDENEGGIVVASSVNWTHVVTAGHHCFIKCGNETFIAYHTYKNRANLADQRALAVDKVIWTKNAAGQDVMHTNGPTWSVQPLPESVSGYKNIAASATITSNNTAAGSDVKYLNDGIVKYRHDDCAVEYEANTGKTTIKLSWNDYKTARAVMIYNSYDYYKTFVDVEKVQIEYKKADGSAENVEIKNLGFDWDWCGNLDYEDMKPGGAAIAEFAELPVKSITIVINSPEGAEALAISDIVVLGKDTACAGVSQFAAYSYTNPAPVSAKLTNESATFGAIAEANLETMYGYDLSHDDGTANAYITQTSVGQQAAYFKGVYANSFYVEADIQVSADQPYHVKWKDGEGNWQLGVDHEPKFGLLVACGGKEKPTNKIFYYVNAKNYAFTQVGCVQQKASGKDWDWNNTDRTVNNLEPLNCRNQAVKLAILREGATFYFFCNGDLIMTVNDFVTFIDGQNATVGFMSFNMGLKISNYSATTDASAIAAKKAALLNN